MTNFLVTLGWDVFNGQLEVWQEMDHDWALNFMYFPLYVKVILKIKFF